MEMVVTAAKMHSAAAAYKQHKKPAAKYGAAVKLPVAAAVAVVLTGSQ
jgi:hypothetical protein